MNKYTDIPYKAKIDTLELSRIILHFLPSYSLEIINELLIQDDSYKNEELENYNNYHDAFHDSFNTYKVFKYIIKEIYKIIEKYPILCHYIKYSNSIYREILDLSNIKYQFFKPFLPPLKKQIQSNKKLINNKSYNLNEYEKFTKLYI
jgi:hypothetical protein